MHHPTRIPVDVQFTQISFGNRHILLRSIDKQTYGAGLNSNFELGLGYTEQQDRYLTPVYMHTLENHSIKKVIAGSFSAAINTDDSILIWGTGEFGVIKQPQMLYMDKVRFADCQVSKYQSCNLQASAIALDSTGKVYTWGSNGFGQLGHGDDRTRKLPTMVLPLKRKFVKQVAIGDGFMIMLGKDFLVNGSQIENTQESVELIKESDQKFECQRQLNYGSEKQGDESFT